MPILDQFPFPFPVPMAQELHRLLAGQYRSERDATAFAEKHGVDPLKLTPGLSPLNLWHEILERAAVAGTVRGMVRAARDAQPNNPRVALLDALLADQVIPVSAEPASKNGSGFVSGSDRVTEPEALLFFDDLTISTGQVPGLIRTLQRMVELAPGVCLLRVQSALGEYFGTGARIGSDLVLTNEHVLFPKGTEPIQVVAEFGLELDAQGKPLQVTALAGDAKSVVGDSSDDWAVVRVPGMDAAWPALDLAASRDPLKGEAAYILQHPVGQRKRLGFVRNLITEVDQQVAHYLTDTQPGSSGAPVFDGEGRVIALHRAGGEPAEVAGKPPVSKNEGILISRVIDGMKRKGFLS